MCSDAVDTYVRGTGGRRLAAGEWGLEADGVAIGLRVVRGVLRAQAWAAPAGLHDPAGLLHRNRALDLVRYAATKAGDVWVVGTTTDAETLDRMLGELVEAARALRPAG